MIQCATGGSIFRLSGMCGLRSLLLLILLLGFGCSRPGSGQRTIPTRLQRTLSQWKTNGGDLARPLREFDEYEIKCKQDAVAVCDALEILQNRSPGDKQAAASFRALIALIPNCHSEVAVHELRDRGLPCLRRALEQVLDRPQVDDEAEEEAFGILKVLAGFAQAEDADLIVRAVRKPLAPDDYRWFGVFEPFDRDHPGWNRLVQGLAEPVTDDASHAVDAAVALAFVGKADRERLLPLALKHPDSHVQSEAAWAAAKTGNVAGLQALARQCQDVNLSITARTYLEELGKKDQIPAAALDPDFEARAEFSHWLAHPAELGHPPDELAIVDTRTLAWPPDGRKEKLWFIRYIRRDRTGLEPDDINCGFVGVTTWCFFSYEMNQRPPEDAYAIYCCWSLEGEKLIEVTKEEDAGKQAAMIGQWHGAALRDANVECVARLSPRLKPLQRTVAVANATRGSEPGWVVLDGPRSAWYAKAEMPEGESGRAILMVHVGRQLLGFTNPVDRVRFLAKPPAKPDSQQIVTAYSRLLDEARTGTVSRRKCLLAEELPLLAEIWQKKGRGEDAQRLILDAMQQAVEKAAREKRDEQAETEKCFQRLRAAFLRLFPQSDALTKKDLPASLLPDTRLAAPDQ